MKTEQQHFSHHVSVPSDEGTKIDKTITINRPVPEVFSFWRRFENLPRFMRHIESVTQRDNLHSHWVVKTVGGQTFEWDAEIIEQRENEMISWRSTPGADVGNAGSVWFMPANGGQATRVRVELKYVPPAGNLGVAFAKVFGRDGAAEIAQDLRRLKGLLETGELPQNGAGDNWSTRAFETGRKAAQATDDYVHDSPWIVMGSVALGCFLVGYLLGRRE
jgi:uncharacterized membrane protein